MAVGRGGTLREQIASSHVFLAAAAVGVVTLAFGVVRPDPTTVESLTFAAAVFAGLAVVGLLTGRSVGGVVGFAGLYLAVVGGTWLALAQLGVLWTAIALPATATLVGYGLYRYQVVTLGTAGESR